MGTIQIQQYHSSAGELVLGSFEDKLCICDWTVEPRHERIISRLQNSLRTRCEVAICEVLVKAAAELDEYFAGKRTAFDVPLLFIGTEFQKSVWNLLLTIPYGKIVSYGEMACMLGRPHSVRAVANANGANAISIFVPCHRVIGSNGSLTGYGGGLNAKKILLELENPAN